MDTVTLLPQSIPRIWFAHEYGSREYDIPFPVMADRLEICHLIEGDVSREQGGRTVRIPRGSVVVNDYSCPVRYYGEGGYCLHRTVGLQMSFRRASAEDALVLPLVLCPGTAAALAGQTISRIIAEYAVSGPGSAKCVSLVFELFSLLDLKEPCGSRSGTRTVGFRRRAGRRRAPLSGGTLGPAHPGGRNRGVPKRQYGIFEYGLQTAYGTKPDRLFQPAENGTGL